MFSRTGTVFTECGWNSFPHFFSSKKNCENDSEKNGEDWILAGRENLSHILFDPSFFLHWSFSRTLAVEIWSGIFRVDLWGVCKGTGRAVSRWGMAESFSGGIIVLTSHDRSHEPWPFSRTFLVVLELVIFVQSWFGKCNITYLWHHSEHEKICSWDLHWVWLAEKHVFCQIPDAFYASCLGWIRWTQYTSFHLIVWFWSKKAEVESALRNGQGCVRDLILYDMVECGVHG